jgi:hypothetical protein
VLRGPMPESISSCGDCSAPAAEQHLAPRLEEQRLAADARLDAGRARPSRTIRRVCAEVTTVRLGRPRFGVR